MFGREQLHCMVVSNHYRNRAVVLHVQDAEWNGAYMILSYGWKSWRPVWILAIIDYPSNGTITRRYMITMNEIRQYTVERISKATIGCHVPQEPTAPIPATSAMHVCKVFGHFHTMFTTNKAQWFMEPHTAIPTADWHVEMKRFQLAANTIQREWRNSISCPFFQLCINRLLREFRDLESSNTC